MYCEKCKHLFDGDRCPNCRKSHVRPVQPEDPCFLVEKGAPWNGMLAGVLLQNGLFFNSPLLCVLTYGADPPVRWYY